MKELNPGKIRPNTDSTGRNGYPEKDVNKGVTHMDMKGAGAGDERGVLVLVMREVCWCW